MVARGNATPFFNPDTCSSSSLSIASFTRDYSSSLERVRIYTHDPPNDHSFARFALCARNWRKRRKNRFRLLYLEEEFGKEEFLGLDECLWNYKPRKKFLYAGLGFIYHFSREKYPRYLFGSLSRERKSFGCFSICPLESLESAIFSFLFGRFIWKMVDKSIFRISRFKNSIIQISFRIYSKIIHIYIIFMIGQL